MNTLVSSIKNKILEKSDYIYVSELDDIKLDDNVLLYNANNYWKIIPLNICLSYPIIYDEYEYEDKIYDISIIVCPLTLKASIFRGKFVFDNYYEMKMYVREIGDTEFMMSLDNGFKIDDKYYIIRNKRTEAQIMTLKNALTMVPDVLYLKTDKKKEYVIEEDYYKNKLDINDKKIESEIMHPKTMVRIVQYKKGKKDRINIILGSDVSKDEITGFDIKSSGFKNYLLKKQHKIVNKKGYIMSMMWMYAREEYKNGKITYI